MPLEGSTSRLLAGKHGYPDPSRLDAVCSQPWSAGVSCAQSRESCSQSALYNAFVSSEEPRPPHTVSSNRETEVRVRQSVKRGGIRREALERLHTQ